MAKAEILIQAELDDDLIQAFLQHVRDFDTDHPGQCHFRMAAVADGKTVAEMDAIFAAIRPPFTRRETYRKQ